MILISEPKINNLSSLLLNSYCCILTIESIMYKHLYCFHHLDSFKGYVSNYLSKCKTSQTNICIQKKLYKLFKSVLLIRSSKMIFNFDIIFAF